MWHIGHNALMTQIYFIQAGDNGPIKIGYAANLVKRMGQLQIGNSMQLTLLGNYPGGHAEESRLQRRFATSLIRGEWYTTSEALLALVAEHPPTTVQKIARIMEHRGPRNPRWRGVEARLETKHARLRRRFPITEETKCEHCKTAKATDRKCKDGDYANFDKANVLLLCRPCRMTLDGSLAKLLEAGHRTRYIVPLKPCANCKTPAKPLRKGLCHNCNEYFRRNQKHRPIKLVNQ